jgi:serine/threonine-protein kinase RsbT
VTRVAVLPLRDGADVVAATRRARRLAADEGFDETRAAAFATAVSELARNVLVHAGYGEVRLEVREEPEGARARRGVAAVVRDEGPGIADPESAMRDGWSTGEGLGLGLPSARRLVDALEIAARPGGGASITIVKWADPGAAHR